MTPRPPTHREPTDEEMQCLPEGTLILDGDEWLPSTLIGKSLPLLYRPQYAVPITNQEEAQEPRKTLRDEFAMAALKAMDLTRLIIEADESGELELLPAMVGSNSYRIADAMLAARNNQPEKV